MGHAHAAAAKSSQTGSVDVGWCWAQGGPKVVREIIYYKGNERWSRTSLSRLNLDLRYGMWS